MKKYELYTDYHDVFEYRGKNEIERIRIRDGRPVRHDWFVFDTRDDDSVFFARTCGHYFPKVYSRS